MTILKAGKLFLAEQKRFILFVTIPLVSSCVMFLYLYHFVRVVPVSSPVITNEIQEQPIVVVSPPVRIQIPSITVDTTITPVGLTADGDMAIDDNPDTVAWYQTGPKPGEKGSAVIAGHYGWKDGHGSIFNNLNTLKAGDKILIDNQSGTQVVFIVREIRTYDPEADATIVFKSTDAKVHLNLISCIGTWVNAEDSYSQRIVVFSDLE
jgi:LPXTG-site transpeptidase (sortase) family protein